VNSSRDRDDERITALAFAAARGDQRAYADWVRSTQADVWRFVAHLTDSVAADDLTQETYARAVISLPRFAGRSSSRTWPLSIARRAVVDHFRARSFRPQHSGQDWETTIEEQSVRSRADSSGFEEVVEVGLLLRGLDDERREALVLTQLLGYTYAEAAEICGCPIGTVLSRIARAREDLLAARDERGNAI
jgi:RNA polymerase sigma-70 factor (ECF subfamily)